MNKHAIYFDKYSELYRVTSDCKPWMSSGLLKICKNCGTVQKVNNQILQNEIAKIYKDYSIYHQGSGSEQVVFENESGSFKSRSFQIISKLKENNLLDKVGILLDIGCGNGGFLKAFQNLFPDWISSGYEISEKYKSEVLAIPNVASFYSGSFDLIKEKYDLITLIHVLEHLSNPQDYLKKIKNLLSSKGVLLIQVPNFRENPFDLLIADHIVHYNLNTLELLVSRIGGKIIYYSQDLVPKEITICIFFGDVRKNELRELFQPENTSTNFAIVNKYIDGLKKFINIVTTESKNAKSLGVFGTSIAATWVFSELFQSGIDFFVEEDPNRVGKEIFNVPIIIPEKVPPDSTLIFPFKAKVADSIFQRLFSNKRIHYLSTEF